jgi:hypothetical protein
MEMLRNRHIQYRTIVAIAQCRNIAEVRGTYYISTVLPDTKNSRVRNYYKFFAS